jgi:WD40 repeat protein
MLAIGSHDNDIYIFKVNGNSYTLHGKLEAHKSFITNMDWSKDGKYIQSNCGAYELLFFDVNSKKQSKSGASQLRDEKWATYTVKLGWWVQGIFPPATSGDHVNGVDRNKGEDVIATGDDWGFVNLYGNPTTKGAKLKAYRGHASHVVRVMFDANDSYLYSIGGYDKTLMKWKVC